MNPGHRINYKALRKIYPEAARMAVLQYLKSNGGGSGTRWCPRHLEETVKELLAELSAWETRDHELSHT